MKRVLMIGIMLFLLVTLAACGQENIVDTYEDINSVQEQEPEIMESGEVAIAVIEFLSLEDFLKTYVAASTGGHIAELADNWLSTQSVHRLDLEAAIEDVNLIELETLYLPTGIPEDFELRLVTVTDYYVALRYLPEEVVVADRTEFWDAAALHPMFEANFTRGRWGERPMFELRFTENALGTILEPNHDTLDLTDTDAVRAMIVELAAR